MRHEADMLDDLPIASGGLDEHFRDQTVLRQGHNPKSMAGVLHEWKHGELHSGSSSGPVVHNQKQAIAIGLSEQRQMGKK